MTTDNHNLDPIENLVIVGGGTAGWMAAAAISKVFQDRLMRVTLIESDAIGTVGVGEATIPEICRFNRVLGIDENEFLSAVKGTFKLGIRFKDWGALGDDYIHPFGKYGAPVESIPFFHYWKKLNEAKMVGDIGDYSLAVQSCKASKFTRPVNLKNSPLSEIAYAFHFDAALYAQYLRGFAESRGVRRVNGTIVDAEVHPDTGDIVNVRLESGEVIEADFFIDCSGFRGLLIEQKLNTGYEDWSDQLPCDSAVTVPSEVLSPLPPYTQATAQAAGWQWRIPLQHRTGNGYVYSSRYISDEDAKTTLLSNIEGEVLGEPRLVRFKTGKRKKIWNKNCLALGLSSGFIEPLESTSIHLVHESIANFLGLFPNKTIEPVLRDKFNAQLDKSYRNIRDFIVLHYNATQRKDSPFWNYCRQMEIPHTLRMKIDMFKKAGRIFRENNELFGEVSWLAVMHGQGIETSFYNPIVDVTGIDEVQARLESIKSVIDRSADAMPTHADFIAKHCASSNS